MGDHLNPGSEGCSELRWHCCTPALATELDSVKRKERKRKEEIRARHGVLKATRTCFKKENVTNVSNATDNLRQKTNIGHQIFNMNVLVDFNISFVINNVVLKRLFSLFFF